jgi:hypothetical protein
MIKYEAKCSNCGRVYPVLLTDPSKAPRCCNQKMDALAVDTEEYHAKIIESLGFYDTKKNS